MSAEVAAESATALPLSELPPGTSTAVEAFGTTVAIFNVEGRLLAVSNHCPHHGGPLCHGRISGTALASRPQEYRYGREGRVLVCPWHGWEFDLERGQTIFDPSVRLRVYGARIDNGEIVLTRRRRKV